MFSQNAADHLEFAFTTYFHPDIPQGMHPGQDEKKLAWPNGYPSGSSLSLHRGGYGQSNTHSHIVTVCSLQLPPLRIPAIKLAPGTLFFLIFWGTSASLSIRAESLPFCPNPRIYFLVIWPEEWIFILPCFFLGEVKQLHGEWALKLIAFLFQSFSARLLIQTWRACLSSAVVCFFVF